MKAIEYVVVAKQGRDGRNPLHTCGATTAAVRAPVAPAHLFRPGKGATLCGLGIDMSWERFADCDGVITSDGCPQCRAAALPAPALP